MSIIDKMNKKKCDKVWKKINNLLRDQDQCIVTLSTLKGYDDLFRRIKDAGYVTHINDSMRESIFVTVEKNKKEGLMI